MHATELNDLRFASFRPVISVLNPTARVTFPAASKIGNSRSRIQHICPSGRRIRILLRLQRAAESSQFARANGTFAVRRMNPVEQTKGILKQPR